MNIKKFKNKQEASLYVANSMAKDIKANQKIILGLATGDTPLDLYNNLVAISLKENINFENVKTFNLDEYVGIDINHIQSYHTYMKENLFSKLPTFNENNSFFPNEDSNYDDTIEKSGGIDVQILGIGVNGHIAFNEPGSEKDSVTRKVSLDDKTIEANSRFFNSKNEVPKEAFSMGLKTIMKAKKIFILIFGKNKAEALSKLQSYKSFDKSFPASILSEHPNVEVICDQEAEDYFK